MLNEAAAMRALSADIRRLSDWHWRLNADLLDAIDRSRELLAQTQRLLDAVHSIELPHRPLPRQARQRPKRNRLHYKHRWLISANVVAALRRAGVDCDIIVPVQDDRPALAPRPPRLALN
jgi:hypothetical protein